MLLAFALISSQTTKSDSNIAPGSAYSWGSNIGWLDWRPDLANGVEVGQFICSGYIYSPNVGWITVGDGSPQNQIQYQNNSGSDFGLNMDLAGNLRGYGYGANIGWINFESTGAARVDMTTGRLAGFAYAANAGWIGLGDTSFSLAVQTITPGVDSDADGIPDAWELSYAETLAVFSATSDFDRDGQNDSQEYLADTDPYNPSDRLQVLVASLSPDKANLTLAWSSKPTRVYLIESRSAFDPNDSWLEIGLGPQTSDGERTHRTLPTVTAPQFFRVRAVRLLIP